MSLLFRRRVAQKTSSKIPITIHIENYGVEQSPANAQAPYLSGVEVNGTYIDSSTMNTYEHPWLEIFNDYSTLENMAYYGDYDHTYDQWYDVTLDVIPSIGGPGASWVPPQIDLYIGVNDLTINDGDDPSSMYTWYGAEPDGSNPYDISGLPVADPSDISEIYNQLYSGTTTDYYDGAGPGTYEIYAPDYYFVNTGYAEYTLHAVNSPATLTVN